MKHFKRIAITSTILIGSTLAFGFWALNKFNNAFSDIDEAYKIHTINPYKNPNQITQFSQSTSTATSTTVASLETSNHIASTTTKNTETTQEKNTNTGFKFTFPKKDTNIYTNCSYKISWNSSDVKSINLSLVDAGTKKPLLKTYGIPKNLSGENLTGFDWKVGFVWPGEYYILAGDINNVNWQEKSPVFTVVDTPDGTKPTDSICNQ